MLDRSVHVGRHILNFALHGFQDSRTVTVLSPVVDLE